MYAPLIIALVSVYINNSGDMYDLRIHRINRSIAALHGVKNAMIRRIYQRLITDKDHHRLVYQDVRHLEPLLLNMYYHLFNYLNDLNLNMCHVRMNTKQSWYTWHYLKNISRYIQQVRTLTFDVWVPLEFYLRHSTKKEQESSKYTTQVINRFFKHAKPQSMDEIMHSLKYLDRDLVNFRNLLNPLRNQWLITYEFKRPFLGEQLIKRYHMKF